MKKHVFSPFFAHLAIRISIPMLLFLLAATYTHAQDEILLQTGEEIQCKVLEISTSEIKFKRWSNLEGPVISIERKDVWMIRYENGTKELINKVSDNFPEPKRDESAQNTTPATQPVIIIQEPVKRFSTNILGGISFPVGDFADPTVGAAKTGFSIGIEEALRLGNSDVSLLGHLSYSRNGFKGEAFLDDEFFSFSGAYSSLWSMSGLKFQSATKKGGLYALIMGGFCYSRLSVDGLGGFVNNLPFSMGIGGGYSFGTANIGLRYYSNKSIFTSDTYYLPVVAEQPIKNIQLSVGIEF